MQVCDFEKKKKKCSPSVSCVGLQTWNKPKWLNEPRALCWKHVQFAQQPARSRLFFFFFLMTHRVKCISLFAFLVISDCRSISLRVKFRNHVASAVPCSWVSSVISEKGARNFDPTSLFHSLCLSSLILLVVEQLGRIFCVYLVSSGGQLVYYTTVCKKKKGGLQLTSLTTGFYRNCTVADNSQI